MAERRSLLRDALVILGIGTLLGCLMFVGYLTLSVFG